MARKLSDQQKIDIVRQYTVDRRSCRSLAKEYGVTDRNIINILRYRKITIRSAKEQNG